MNSSNSQDAPVYAGNAIDQPAQVENIPHMDHKLYKAASVGDFRAFENMDENLNLLLTPDKNTILHIYITARTNLMQQFKRIRHTFLKEILKKCSSLLTQRNVKDETPLHIAARYGHHDIVLILLAHDYAHSQHEDIESGAAARERLIRMRTIGNDTALHEAARGSHHKVVQILIREDPHLLNMANNAGETPLYLAAERGYRRIVYETLETRRSTAAYDGPDGRTALHAAVIADDAEMTRKILEVTVDLTKKKDHEQGWTPLHYASYLSLPRIAELLLESDKSAAYIRDRDGRTPLLVAAANQHRRGNSTLNKNLKVMITITTKCPDCSEIVDNKGRNVLHICTQNFKNAAMRALLRNPSLFNLINRNDEDGNTPLHLLINVGFVCDDLIRHCLVDKKAVNNDKLTAADILRRRDILDLAHKSRIFWNMSRAGHKSSWRSGIQEEPMSVRKERVEKVLTELKTAKNTHLIVATLIATVTFAAGFTLPGGYNTNGNDQGTAILTKRAAFKAFLITDTVAMLLSTSVAFIHVFLAVQGDKRRFIKFFMGAFVLLIIAMLSMVLAFATGAYAVLPISSGLGIVICVFTACLFICFYYILCHSVPLSQIRKNDSVLVWR